MLLIVIEFMFWYKFYDMCYGFKVFWFDMVVFILYLRYVINDFLKSGIRFSRC